MFDSLAITPVIMFLPLALAAALLLMLPATAAPGARPHALATTLAFTLLTTLIGVVAARANDTGIVATQYIVITLSLLAAGLIAGPLLDRARARGLILAASIAGIAIIYVLFHHLPALLPAASRISLLYVAVIAASVMGIGGSLILPLNAARFTNDGQAKWQEVQQGALLAGWLIVALVLAALVQLLSKNPVAVLPMAVTALTAALFALLRAKNAPFDPMLQKSGEALAAGLLISALVTFTLPQAVIAGLIAGFFASKSESMTNALRVDDAHHITGALLFPALLGLLMPGFLNLKLLAGQLHWLGTSVAMGLVAGIILWPAVMFVFGLAARRA